MSTAHQNHGWPLGHRISLSARESELLAALKRSTLLLSSVPLVSANPGAQRIAAAQAEQNRALMAKCGGAA